MKTIHNFDDFCKKQNYNTFCICINAYPSNCFISDWMSDSIHIRPITQKYEDILKIIKDNNGGKVLFESSIASSENESVAEIALKFQLETLRKCDLLKISFESDDRSFKTYSSIIDLNTRKFIDQSDLFVLDDSIIDFIISKKYLIWEKIDGVLALR